VILQILFLTLALTNPNVLLKSADSFVMDENWEEASKILENYIQSADPPIAEAFYDYGIAQYHLGNFEHSTRLFDDAISASNDPSLQAYSAFNMGNSIYQRTMEGLEGTGTESSSSEAILDIEHAKEQLQQVLQQYRSAIASNKSDMDARANGELAWQMLQQLNQMQEQMEQQQEEDQTQQEKNEDSAEQQQDSEQKNEHGDSDQEQESQEGEQSNQEEDGEQGKQGQNEQSQNSKSDENPEQQNQNDEQTDQEQEQNKTKDGDETDQENKKQDQNQQSNDEFNQQEDIEPNEPKEGELETTDEQMNESKGRPSTVKDEGERLSESEADRLLQLIRDKEQQRRKALAAKRDANRTSAGKDW